MVSRSQVADALERARETVRTTRSLAERLKGTKLRDILVLEALALQSVIDRIECNAAMTQADASELDGEVDRIMKVVSTTGTGRVH